MNEQPTDDLTCPYCGATAENFQTWDSVRVHEPQWPANPEIGAEYSRGTAAKPPEDDPSAR